MFFFPQVGKLYISYRLEQPDESLIVENEDIICLLKDRKELYIQKDYLASKSAICRYNYCIVLGSYKAI